MFSLVKRFQSYRFVMYQHGLKLLSACPWALLPTHIQIHGQHDEMLPWHA